MKRSLAVIMQKIDIQEAQICSEIPMLYHHLNKGEQKPLLVFFHGYSDSAQSFLRRCFPDLEESYEILAINGLFPVPHKKNDVWKQAFAWYFADFSSKSILIHPRVCAIAVAHLIEKLGLVNRPKILIGFSQGGFFLPHVLPNLKDVRHLISIGAAYRLSDYQSLTISLDAIHGSVDEVISLEQAESSFEKLKAINPTGQFTKFDGLGHTMNDEARDWFKNRIKHICQGIT